MMVSPTMAQAHGMEQNIGFRESEALLVLDELLNHKESEGGFDFAFVDPDNGKNIVFETNNSMKSRRQYTEKFQSLGLTSVTQDEIFS
ncbi:hypothetical protein HA466_0023120 [Hirschfeldia incana]|nr:hypothetical protein HA466_0023120 [Hirschfeldia incana]